MAVQLSEQQQVIVDCDEPRIVVNACPGSGKTFTTAARMAQLLRENKLSRHQGIAAISFTNTACDVIKTELQNTFGIPAIPYPSFIGTIDSFINAFIFLPYAHLVMGCKNRPEIIGTEYNKWYDYDFSKRNYNHSKITDSRYFMDKVSFDIKDDPFPLVPANEFSFSWKQIRKKTGEYTKAIQDILNSKKLCFSEGKANQADANYLAYKTLKQYPKIAQNLVQRFPFLIIDEAQDTTELQMAIIDILDKTGCKSIVLIGDPHQAIFEWNTAHPELFLKKYQQWYKLNLSENRRSSDKICQIANHFFGNEMSSVAKDKDCTEEPQILTYTEDSASISKIANDFIAKCKKLNLSKTQYAIVYRGQSFGAKYFGINNNGSSDTQCMPWKNGNYFVRDIVYGKYLIDCGLCATGLKLTEKGIYKFNNKVQYASSNIIRTEILKVGFRSYQEKIIKIISLLPPTNNLLADWIKEAKTKTGIDLPINGDNANVSIASLFKESALEDIRPYKTIHSVKGMTLEAILIFLKHKSGTELYTSLLKQAPNYQDKAPDEELRIVYVACTRPKKLLWLAVPQEDVKYWRNKLQGSH